ncbi:Bifunctional NAD(P)H-hydrate repair enzyme Nnr [Roseovarius albus]|uniref:Bifunctional NAD(P)H-hydrate repair enzyme n=1 Tax=Roseovarius albus TaxID=1247867 RepID=A0A1X6ZAT3_9RHOB|nr:NAD(P)H-hydrate dehydratase [Roseovarius albus]SLN45772.1 Bifunctional NAD(P)H-hydrate repair enzyme Nnr [Roseovarius albus]
MTELLTAAQMRAIEQAAIESGEVTGLELMERAGRGVVEAIFEEWPELKKASHCAVVLCGPGNNGGDGFVIARLLKEWGWEVEVFLYGAADKLPPDARVNYERWISHETVSPMSEFDIEAYCPRSIEEAGKAWIIDAIFGTGLTRPIEGELAETLQPLCQMFLGVRPGMIAVDIPSGVCSDSGKVLGLALPAEMTVTFHRAKLGHHLESAGNGTFSLHETDIGLPQRIRNPLQTHKLLKNDDYGMGDWVLCGKERSPDNLKTSHKFSHGHALILSGGSGKTGAARLAARGALRIGAGLVTLGVPPSAQMEVSCQITALMLKRIEGVESFAEVLLDERLNALCLGPGLGLDRAKELVPVALASKRATVLDADALSAFTDAPEALFDLLHDNCVLTPHGGEFARLFPDILAKLNEVPTKGPAYSKVDATREAAKRAGCVVLFKGADTVIAAPDGRCSINSAHYERSTPWLATAGSGDVLAGFITGLMARGFDPMQSAETAAWLHVECALSFGPGLIAEDLPEELPKVFRKLGVS